MKVEMFMFVQKYYGSTSEQAEAAAKLRKFYRNAKSDVVSEMEDAFDESALQSFISSSSRSKCKLFVPNSILPPGEETKMKTCHSLAAKKVAEDVIRCCCNLFKDEGLMIQCEKCLVSFYSAVKLTKSLLSSSCA